MNDVALIETNLINPENLSQAMELAEMICKSQIIPEAIRDPGSCIMVIDQACRWGVPWLAVAQGASIVHGKLMFEGKLINTILQSTGAIVGEPDFEYEGDGLKMTIIVTAVRGSDGATKKVEGSVAEWHTTEKTSGKINHHWKTRPQHMLAYRGIREWARLWAPYAMAGINVLDDFDEVIKDANATVLPETTAPRRRVSGKRSPKPPKTEEVNKEAVTSEPDKTAESSPDGKDGSIAIPTDDDLRAKCEELQKAAGEKACLSALRAINEELGVKNIYQLKSGARVDALARINRLIGAMK